MTKPDLHLHSNCSDGVFSPRQLLQEAVTAGVTVMAVTDHDTFAGADALAKVSSPICVIPGVELSIKDRNGLHLLGYGTSPALALRAEVDRLARKRVDRAKEMLEKLSHLGLPLDWSALERKYRGTVGRPHIARAMVHAGYVRNMQEAFERYIGHDGPAYVGGERLGMEEAIHLMRLSGFVPVVAHPYEIDCDPLMLEVLVQRWKQMGLLGMEVYHPSAVSKGTELLERMARRQGLLVTGGSDFHQPNDKHGAIGSMAASWTRAEEDINDLLEAMTKYAK